MPTIVAVSSCKDGRQVRVYNTKGHTTLSSDPTELLAALVAPYPDTLKVCWNMQEFLEPIVKLLPAEVVKKLNQGQSVWYGEFKLFYGVGKGAMFGVTWEISENVKGNIWDVETYESDIYQLCTFFGNEKPTDIEDVRLKGESLLGALRNMGITPTKLTSPAAIFEEAVLSKINPPTMWDMPEEAMEMVEWCANYCREWRSVYRIGYFENSFDQDLSSAYPSIMTRLPNLRNVHFVRTDGKIPDGAYWGILKGKVNITGNVSPIVHADGKCYRGEYHDYIATNDWRRIKTWGIGDFVPEAGWFIIVDKYQAIFDYTMRRLYDLRNENELQTRLAKGMAASCWGKTLETHVKADGSKEFGKFYNPIYASMTTSGVRCADCDFIYQNGLQDDLLSVTVDGILSVKRVANVNKDKRFGAWRLDNEGPALVLSTPFQWTGDKRPAGVNIEQMLGEIRAHPMKKAWHGVALRFLEHDRQFAQLPKNGHDILEREYRSEPLRWEQ